MTLRQRIRTVTGGLAVVTLLALVAADTIYPGVTLGVEDKILLASVASVLLGLDLAIMQGPLNIRISRGENEDD